MNCQLLHGDCRQVLKTLPDESVNCCVTSPPYFGLRDYGTAQWEGGDSECDHRQPLGGEGATSAKQNTSTGTQTHQYRGVCGKCGATRIDSQIGLEPTPDAYVAELVAVFSEVRRVLRKDGTLWLNLGDSYASNQSNNGGYSDKSTLAGFSNPNTEGRQANDSTIPRKINHGVKHKDLIGIPWLVAFALRSDGWYLRQDIIWHKPNPMPESVKDRCTKAHEYVFLLSKSERYYYDAEAVKEDATGWNGSDFHDGRNAVNHPNVGKNRPSKKRGEFGGKTADQPGREAFRAVTETRNKRSVWTVNTKPYKEAHFATFPPALITPMILAGCPSGGTVLDCFGGSGTTGEVAESLGRNSILIELNPAYIEIQGRRTAQQGLELSA